VLGSRLSLVWSVTIYTGQMNARIAVRWHCCQLLVFRCRNTIEGTHAHLQWKTAAPAQGRAA
jgi:hypothetical protein